MNSTFGVLYELECTSSRNDKKKILLANKEDEHLKKILLYAEDSSKIYGIGKSSLNLAKQLEKQSKKNGDTKNYSLNSLFPTKEDKLSTDVKFFNLLDDLMKHPNGSYEDVEKVQKVLMQCNEEERYWYSKVILKNLKIGCTKKTINGVYKDLIPTFEVMLAHPYSKYVNKLDGQEFMIQEKLDGYRLITRLYKDKIEFFTRNGIQIYDLTEIEEEIKRAVGWIIDKYYGKILERTYLMLDGELIGKDFKETQHIVFTKGQKKGLTYKVFDLIFSKDFELGISKQTLFDRYYNVLEYLWKDTEHCKLVSVLYKGKDLAQINKWFSHGKEKGWEGIMVKLDAPYECKRTSNMLKFKEFKTIDLEVIKVNIGTEGSEFEGVLGSVTVKFKGNEVDVGSGFSKSERYNYYSTPQLINGKIIEIQYFEETINDKGNLSLRFPIFKGVRLDK